MGDSAYVRPDPPAFFFDLRSLIKFRHANNVLALRFAQGAEGKLYYGDRFARNWVNH
jgi:hypothetical protein